MGKKILNWMMKPTSIKLMINATIIIVGAGSGIISIVPEGWMCNEVKVFTLGVMGVISGALKGFEKMIIDSNNEFRKISGNGSI